MKIVITPVEMKAVASYIDECIGYVNRVVITVDSAAPCTPRDTLKKVEEWLNEKLGRTIHQDKIVTIKVIPFIGNVVISVDPEFTADFMGLYGSVLAKITPHVCNIAKEVVAMQATLDQLDGDVEAFAQKWY